MAITKDSVLGISTRSGQTGIFIGTVVLGVKCPNKFLIVLIGSSPVCASWTGISYSFRTARHSIAQYFFLRPPLPWWAGYRVVECGLLRNIQHSALHPAGGIMTTRQRTFERWENKGGVILYQLIHQETNALIRRYGAQGAILG